MLLPRSIAYGRLVLYHSFYIPHISIHFLIFGLFLQLSFEKKRFGIRLVSYLLLFIAAGLGGVRHVIITCVPLLMTVFLHVTRRVRSNPLVVILDVSIKREVVFAALGCIGWMIGFFINSRILSNSYVFSHKWESFTALVSPNNIEQLVNSYLRSFGYNEWYQIFSIRGILAISGFLASIASFICILHVYNGVDPESKEWFPSAIYFSIHIATMSTVVFLFLTSYGSHILPAYSMLIPTLAVSAYHGQKSGQVQMRKFLATATALSVLCVGFYHSLFFRDPNSRDLEYLGLSYRKKFNVQELEDIAQYLETECYSIGYAPFWQASVIREMTDGRVKTLAMGSSNLHYYSRWLNEWQLNDPEVLNAEKHFLMAPNDDTDKLEQAATLQFSGSDYSVWTFSSGEALWEYVN